MGLIRTSAAVRNPAKPDQVWEGTFLVDTGAIDCLVPRPHLEAIGLRPEGQRKYTRADGSEEAMDVTVGRIEFTNVFVGATILFGEASSEPLLGATALESLASRWIRSTRPSRNTLRSASGEDSVPRDRSTDFRGTCGFAEQPTWPLN